MMTPSASAAASAASFDEPMPTPSATRAFASALPPPRRPSAPPPHPPPAPPPPPAAADPNHLAADDAPVGLGRGRGGFFGRAYAKPERHRRLRLRPHPPQELDGLRRQPLANPGD